MCIEQMQRMEGYKCRGAEDGLEENILRHQAPFAFIVY